MDDPRTNLDMWSDALRLLECREFESGYSDHYGRAYTSCDECKAIVWPISRGDQKEPTHKPNCAMARALTELRAFVDVESKIEEARLAREEADEPEPPTAVEIAVAAEREACAYTVETYARPPAWIDGPIAKGIAAAIRARGEA